MMNLDPVKNTITAYEDNAIEYISNTFTIENFPYMSQKIDDFLKVTSGNKLVLDVGFRSGRDSLYMQKKELMSRE